MPNNRHIYWDSNVFLSLLNAMPARIETLKNLVAEIEENSQSYILTSSESIVEVAHIAEEKTRKRLDPAVEEQIDAMWANNELIKMIDNGPHIAPIARNLIREAIPNGWRLTPKDAVHLASAYWYNKYVHPIDEIHTYDQRLFKFEAMVGIHICEPYPKQMRLNGV